ncbi:MAG: hypothetical protein Q8N39_01165 [Pelolinea sp.]|nr:hypothetical protein [Pelolinea sp.]
MGILKGFKMSKYLIGFLVVISAIALAIVAAFGISPLINRPNTSIANSYWGPRMMGGGMMGYRNQSIGGNRLTIDEAVLKAKNNVASTNSNLSVAEVMSFQNNFYIAVKEIDSGRSAFELLMDPVTGNIASEPGPNMMWNQKYGHMMFLRNKSGENPINLEESRQLAQKALDSNIPGGMVEPDGFNFYGYYTFDYKINGVIAGMLSINGFNGQDWFHTWHGSFIDEKEVNK